jgi:hypothetical protein
MSVFRLQFASWQLLKALRKNLYYPVRGGGVGESEPPPPPPVDTLVCSCFYANLFEYAVEAPYPLPPLPAPGRSHWLMAAAGCCWLLLADAGCCWLLLAAAGCWLKEPHHLRPHAPCSMRIIQLCVVHLARGRRPRRHPWLFFLPPPDAAGFNGQMDSQRS